MPYKILKFIETYLFYMWRNEKGDNLDSINNSYSKRNYCLKALFIHNKIMCDFSNIVGPRTLNAITINTKFLYYTVF